MSSWHIAPKPNQANILNNDHISRLGQIPISGLRVSYAEWSLGPPEPPARGKRQSIERPGKQGPWRALKWGSRVVVQFEVAKRGNFRSVESRGCRRGWVTLFLPLHLVLPIFFISLTILIVCVIAWSELEDDRGSVGSWLPRRNKRPGIFSQE